MRYSPRGNPTFLPLCWANESWYRRWQGTVDEMLVEQTFSEEDDLDHIRWLIECFKDPRYIRISWQTAADGLSGATTSPIPLGPLHSGASSVKAPGVGAALARCRSRRAMNWSTPPSIGFDTSAEFVPHFINQLAS